MTLQELHDQLASHFPPYAQKDLRTAIRILAKALQYPDPSQCPLDQFNRPLPSIYKLVETHLSAQGKSAHTIRNTKNNLSRLFRLAEDQNLFSLIPLPLTPHYDYLHRPARPGSVPLQNNQTYLPYAKWPTDLQDAFTDFAIWATAPLVSERKASLRKRPATIESYRHAFEPYFGFLHHIRHIPIPTFDHLFDLELLTTYVHWHVNDLHHRPTKAIHLFLTHILSLTRQYRPLPELRARIKDLKKTIPIPNQVYNKEDAWVSLATLNEIARSLWPHKQPKTLQDKQHPGLRFAGHAGLSLMFRLWTYIPYRQRNIREMQLNDNLYKDTQGKWRIAFRGEQLKISTKGSRLNVFDLPFPETLVPVLEEYLQTWRPVLIKKALQPSQHVFLSQRGTPYNGLTLQHITQNTIYRYTGKYWHPHIIRTVWATEWIRKTHGDFYTAAIMLNDRLETVIAKYTHLLDENVAEKAYKLIDERNGQGK